MKLVTWSGPEAQAFEVDALEVGAGAAAYLMVENREHGQEMIAEVAHLATLPEAQRYDYLL